VSFDFVFIVWILWMVNSVVVGIGWVISLL